MKIRGYLIHCCALDRHCWKMWWHYGAPIRLHLGKRYWDILSGNRRSKRIWKDAKVLKRNPFSGKLEEVSDDDQDEV